MPHVAGLRGVVTDPSSNAPAQDATRAVYRYHQAFAGPGGRTLTRKSVILAARLAPWSEGMIRPHEETTPAQVEAVLAQLRATRTVADPVLAGIRDGASEIDRLFKKVDATPPTVETTTPDGVTHRVWRVQDAELFGKLRSYLTPKKLHVLDGHDRYEAMLAYQAELASKQDLATYSSANYALTCVVPMDDAALLAAARHKVVRGLTQKREDILAAASTYFIVDKLAGAAADLARMGAALADTLAHQPAVVVVFAGEPDAWKLTLSPEVSLASAGVTTVDRRIAKLDAVVAEHLLLRKLAGAQVSTETDATHALAALAKGASAAVILRPLTVEQIAHVDEIGQRLPPQTTAFYPPLARGLVGMVIAPDEDLV